LNIRQRDTARIHAVNALKSSADAPLQGTHEHNPAARNASARSKIFEDKGSAGRSTREIHLPNTHLLSGKNSVTFFLIFPLHAAEMTMRDLMEQEVSRRPSAQQERPTPTHMISA
jgi:hypothetical protein